MEGVHMIQRIVASGWPRLIGDETAKEIMVVEEAHRFGCAWDEV
jgi:hypothetical protein